TALYLKKLLYGQPVRVTRIALGVPMGGSLEYSDVVTLTRAMKGRNDF
ncbi:MAG: recombination protein RecR, partial [Deltaproteobacteria bacterium]|nr:recombination protein RecR [Deltaproteobacteria bacterium]